MINLSKKVIDKIFEAELKADNPHQQNILLKLYKKAFKNYDDIEKLENWPTIGKETTNYIFEKFIKFDKQIHPDIFAGGLWLNNGFSWNNNLENWKIDISMCKIKYKGAKND